MHQIIGFKERRYIEELRIITKSTAIDCIIDDSFDRVIYVVRRGDMGIAIGKNGENIRKMQKVLGKRVEMVEEAENLQEFVKHIFRPVEVSSQQPATEDSPMNIFVPNKSDLGIAIGRGGANVEKARLLCRRFYHVEVGEIHASDELAA